ncbi:MAG: ribosome silencing factor [Pseudomonadota bacterium]|nr:ribosome silencing factor [Pseudomonadota bacterium]
MELLNSIVCTLEDMKGIDLVSLDVGQLTSITDHMVIVSGNTSRHTRSMMNALLDMAVKHKFEKPRVEGDEEGQWILVNFGDVICHIMLPDIRQYYALEKLWST